MKKIVNILILVIVCLLPTVVDAKANFEFKSEYMDELFLYRDDDKYYFFNSYVDLNSTGSIVYYDKNNELIGSDKFIDGEEYSQEAIIESKYYEPYYKMFVVTDGAAYDKDNKLLMYVDYEYELFSYYDYEQNKNVEIDFNDDLDYTKEILGDRFNVYLKLKDSVGYLSNIVECNGYFIVYYEDEEEVDYVSVLDKEYKFILTFENSVLGKAVYVYDDLIYIMELDDLVAVYKLDGTKVTTLNINHEFISDNSDDNHCNNYYPELIYIENNDFYISYSRYICETRIVNFESGHNDLVGFKYIDDITLKYNLNFDVETVLSNDGELTYETKVDEDGREYVELKVVPKDGYSVKEIIVTDLNGNRIEVTNNKFYKPVNDVKIEVKYIKGEYLPIPDTSLSKSLTLVLIGVLLVILGSYTISYIKKDKKVEI